MNRKQVIAFFGHPQTVLAANLGIPKQRLQSWKNAKGVTDRSRAIASMCGCSVVEFFYSHPLHEINPAGALGLDYLEIALEALKCYQDETGVDVSEVAKKIYSLQHKQRGR